MKEFIVSGMIICASIGVVALASIELRAGQWPTVRSVAKAVGLPPSAGLTEWEHGFKTDRVTATRMHGDMGWNARLEFPKNAYDSDRAEVSDLINAYGGSIFQGGGFPGAPAYVVFPGVGDKEKMTAKLKELLPPLSDLMRDISSGGSQIDIKPYLNANALARVAEKEKPENQWPNTTPIDKSNPYWEFNNNMNANGTPYHKVEVSPGKWQWVVDEKALKYQQDEEYHRVTLFDALTTRVLTDNELKEVQQYGDMLNIQPLVSYNPDEKSRELTAAIDRQSALRRLAEASKTTQP